MLTYIRERARREFKEALFESCADEAIALQALAIDSHTPNAAIRRADGRVYRAGSLFAPTLESALTIALACLAIDGCVSVTI